METDNQNTSTRLPLMTRVLAVAPGPVFAAWAIFAAFSTYFCMYAFRKPFGAGQYEGFSLWGTSIDLKTAFVVSQIIGYAISKFIGIKICSEVPRHRRMWMLLGFIGLAQFSLILFAILPANMKVFAMFLNGLPLGMVWGLVVWYLEGRRTSELLLAGLSCSFILASGIVKDAGRWLMDVGVGEFWMPAMTGFLFLGPYLIAVWMLNQLPQPSQLDEDARTHREPMDAVHRLAFLKHFLPGLVVLFVAYFFLTAYRDFRDSFGVEIFAQLGMGEEEQGLFFRSEIWVAFGVLIPLALLFLIRNNRWGLIGAFTIMLCGAVALGMATILLDAGRISGLTFMIMTGLGSYLAYVPYGSVLFDRLIASTRVTGTAVFAIYVADAIGYTGAISVMIFKDVVVGDMSRLEFFRYLTYFMSVLGLLCLGVSMAYFLMRARASRHREQDQNIAQPSVQQAG